MKVLVYFEQEFYSTEAKYNIRIRENICRVFEASSNKDLLNQFEAWDFIPFYIRKLCSDSKKILSGKKTMVWYLPENNKPQIKDNEKGKYEMHSL